MPDYRIEILTMPISNAGVIPLSNLVTIFSSLSKNIFLITGEEGYKVFREDRELRTFNISHTTSTFFMRRILNYLSTQIKMSWLIFRTRNNIDVCIFFMGGETLLLPIIMAYLFRKKIIIMFSSSAIKIHSSQNDPLTFMLKILQAVCCTFSDRIIVYADSLIAEYYLGRWTEKIVIAHEHYIDFDKFRIKKEYRSRERIVGFIGRLSEEKGIWNFILAIEIILKDRLDIQFIITGEGLLYEKIKNYLSHKKMNRFVKIQGWVSHDNLPDNLNELKLLVIPSYTEGLPNVMLESMACGTPVLASSVGMIPDLIKNGKTGFIMEGNSPESIAENITRVMYDLNPEKIVPEARRMVEEKFSFDYAINLWKSILETI